MVARRVSRRTDDSRRHADLQRRLHPRRGSDREFQTISAERALLRLWRKSRRVAREERFRHDVLQLRQFLLHQRRHSGGTTTRTAESGGAALLFGSAADRNEPESGEWLALQLRHLLRQSSAVVFQHRRERLLEHVREVLLRRAVRRPQLLLHYRRRRSGRHRRLHESDRSSVNAAEVCARLSPGLLRLLEFAARDESGAGVSQCADSVRRAAHRRRFSGRIPDVHEQREEVPECV